MDFISWGSEYETNLPLIDAQHKKLFAIINDYHKSEITTDAMFGELFAYIDFHFKTEEYYFDKFNYKFTSEHKAGHKYYQDTTKKIYERYLEDLQNSSIREELEDFVRDWISDHIRLSDMMYKACFMEHGLGERNPVLPKIKM